ncbi:hypothetical protein H1C71_021309 [Ictidomys tridecemlineatus]|nr:hypothetical protein H1C71_021309 [Ictidomys tridecemlineatus]
METLQRVRMSTYLTFHFTGLGQDSLGMEDNQGLPLSVLHLQHPRTCTHSVGGPGRGGVYQGPSTNPWPEGSSPTSPRNPGQVWDPQIQLARWLWCGSRRPPLHYSPAGISKALISVGEADGHSSPGCTWVSLKLSGGEEG